MPDPDAKPTNTGGPTLPTGTLIRGTHPYSFRTGQFAQLVAHDQRPDGRPLWLVAFPDGATDVWVADDPDAGWEYHHVQEAPNAT